MSWLSGSANGAACYRRTPVLTRAVPRGRACRARARPRRLSSFIRLLQHNNQPQVSQARDLDWSTNCSRHRRQRSRCAAAMRAFPSVVRGPVLSPPCNLQRPFRGRFASLSQTAGARQACPSRHFAPHSCLHRGFGARRCGRTLNKLSSQ